MAKVSEILYTYISPTDTGLVTNTRWEGQSFTTIGAFTLYSVEWDMSRDSNDPGAGTVVLLITDAAAGGDPSGKAILGTSIAHTGSDISVSPTAETREFIFSPRITLSAVTEYAFILKTISFDSGANVKPSLRNSAGDYAGGSKWQSTDSGSSYSEVSAADHQFEIFSFPLAADFVPSDVKYTRKLVTFSANRVFTGSTPAGMTELTAARDDIDTGQPLRSVEAYGKVFVANDANLKVADFINVKITTASLGSSSDAPDHGTILTGGTSAAKMSVDYINADTGATTLYGSSLTADEAFSSGETVTGTNKAGNAVSFVTNSAEATGPFWYDWTVYANDTTTYGVMPAKADLIELHIGRVWLNNTESPHQWHASRQNNPFDFIYGVDDVGSGVKGNDTDAGEVGDILIDFISYSDDYMVMGGSGSLYVMNGNPTSGGTLDKLRNTGLLAARAWDWDDEGNLFLVSTEGLLVIPKGFGPAQNLTSKSYPDFIKDIAYDPTVHRLLVAYDPENFGILISKVTTATGVNTVWWFDTRTNAIFIDEYPEEASFYSMLRFEADDPANSGLLLGCKDGYVRRYDAAQKSDDIGATDEAIDAQVAFGPFKTLGAVRKAGRISNIDIELGGADDGAADDSDDVYVTVYTGDNPDIVIKNMIAGTGSRYTKTHKASGHEKGNVDRRKLRGRWVGFVVGNNTAGESFSIEKISYDGI